MAIHDGHRDRVRERFRKEGLDNFNEINALELLLFYCVPRIDTNELAHKLLDYFGSFAAVLDAPREEMEKVPGVGGNTSTFLSLLGAVNRYYQVSKANSLDRVKDLEDCAQILVPQFVGRRDEVVYLLCLDSMGKPICSRFVGEGTVSSTSVSFRKIAEIALGVNAVSVILAHNHPDGVAMPSIEDLETTLYLSKALNTLNISLIDHLIVAGDEHVFLISSGLLPVPDQR